MFDVVARRYGLVNTWFILGQTKAWRKRVLKIMSSSAGMRALVLLLGSDLQVNHFIKQEPKFSH